MEHRNGGLVVGVAVLFLFAPLASAQGDEDDFDLDRENILRDDSSSIFEDISGGDFEETFGESDFSLFDIPGDVSLERTTTRSFDREVDLDRDDTLTALALADDVEVSDMLDVTETSSRGFDVSRDVDLEEDEVLFSLALGDELDFGDDEIFSSATDLDGGFEVTRELDRNVGLDRDFIFLRAFEDGDVDLDEIQEIEGSEDVDVSLDLDRDVDEDETLRLLALGGE